jgi:hypothetical protein
LVSAGTDALSHWNGAPTIAIEPDSRNLARSRLNQIKSKGKIVQPSGQWLDELNFEGVNANSFSYDLNDYYVPKAEVKE